MIVHGVCCLAAGRRLFSGFKLAFGYSGGGFLDVGLTGSFSAVFFSEEFGFYLLDHCVRPACSLI